MNKKNIWILFSLLIFLGCNSNNIREHVKSVEDFKQMLINQLKNDIDVDSISGGNSWGENFYSSTSFIPVNDSSYIHSNTYKICLNVLSKWKEKYGYGADIVSAGGGDNQFSMLCNLNSIYIFTDIISYKHYDGSNRINVLIKAH